MKKYMIDVGTRKELCKFLVVGTMAVATDFTIYYVFLNSMTHSPAKALSFISGTFIAYMFNKYWTFEKKEKSYREMVQFAGLYASTFFVNVGMNKLVLLILPSYVFFAFLAATGSSTILNFIGQKWWVFKRNQSNEIRSL